MRRLFSLATILTFSFGWAQNNELLSYLQIAEQHYALSTKDVRSYEISSDYYRHETSMRHVYLQQTVHGIPIFNAILQLHIHKNERLIFHNSRFIDNAQDRINTTQSEISISQAFDYALKSLKLETPLNCEFFEKQENRFQLNCPSQFIHPVRAKQIYFHKNGQLFLAYEFSFEPKYSDAHTSIVSALDGSILWQQNRVISCQFDHDHGHNQCNHEPKITTEEMQLRNLGQAVYNAFPLSIESPLHGPRAMLNAIENPAASPFGWHDTNGSPGAEYTITRGNNVYAHEDIANENMPGYAPEGGQNLIFDFPYQPLAEPLENLDASITNLFVWNNFLHDISYFYGFDEVSGNFQQTNYSGLGNGNDYVFAHALDGSGTNNANFATPEEGYNPTMQMYIWTHLEGNLLQITEPASIAGTYQTGSSTFGVLPPSTPFNAEIILADDGSINPTLGCDFLTNGTQLQGKIAYFDRGGCSFVQKVINAQNVGAIAVVIANNQQGGAMTLNGNDLGQISIPAISISQAHGALIKEQILLGAPVFANFGGTVQTVNHDSSFDNGIIAHEYGHGISIRLTGGEFQVNCLWNEEQMGEGWSDFFALIVSDTLGTSGSMPRGIGNFASNKPAGAFGIRPFPYTTDMSINPLTYANINGLSIPHGVGSVWCTMLWDLYWAFVDVYGHSHNLYSTTGGNNRAIRLVMEGMRLQVCNPGFVDGRDAILLADEILYNGVHQCLIWQTFARRGLGYNAYQGWSDTVGDEVEDFDIPNFCSGVGLTNFNKPNFVLYPNPGSDAFSIKSLGENGINSIRITDLSGNLVAEHVIDQTTTTIQATSWANGLYFVHIEGNNGNQVLRWVKQ